MAAAKEKVVAQVTIPKLKIGRFTMKLIGDSPLVMHCFGEKARKQIEDRQKGSDAVTAKKEARQPEQDFMSALHVMPGTKPVLKKKDGEVLAIGEFGFPAIGIKASAVTAAVDAGAFKTTMRRAFHIGNDRDDLVRITSDPPVMRTDNVRIGQGSTDVRYRPEFRNWSCEFDVSYNEAVIGVEQIINLFNNAGFGVGIGEWRPERDGLFGRFRVSADIQVGPSELRGLVQEESK